jgi:hypothetical protein
MELCFENQVVCVARRDREGELVKVWSAWNERCFIVSHDDEDWALVKAEWEGLRIGVPGDPADKELRQRGITGKRGRAGSFVCRFIPLKGAILSSGGHSRPLKVQCTGRGGKECPRPLMILPVGERCFLKIDFSS